MRYEIKSLEQIRDEYPDLRKQGRWFALNIERRMDWPTTAQQFTFEEHKLWVVPLTTDHHPGIAVLEPTLDADDAWAMLHRALSFISWYQSSGANVSVRSHAGHFTMSPLGERTAFMVRDSFDFSSLPSVESDAARLALALIREGRAMKHPAYSFLSFYRAIERAIPNGKERGRWITEAVKRLSGHRAVEALGKLRQDLSGDVGEHLYDSGRKAIAHAAAEPVINPDEPRHANRLRRELPIMEELAVRAVEECLGVKSSSTIWREHLYELAGWKLIFGPELIALIREGREPAADHKLDLPPINLRLRRSDPFEPLEQLHPMGWAIHERKGEVQYQSGDQRVRVVLVLDFEAERLIFPLDKGVQFADDGTLHAARIGKAIATFIQAYNANGELQIWNAADGSLMSKCDAFIPVNVTFNPEGAKAELDAWDAEIVRRAMQRVDRGT